MSCVNLAPISPPLGVNPAYCVNKQTTLVMKEKVWSLSGDTFHIVDESNHEVVQCRGQTLSLSDRKEFASSTGQPLFSLRTRLLSLHKSFYAEAPSGETIFEVKGKFSIGSSKMVATFVNASTKQNVELLIKGDWLDRSASITMGNIVVAQISRSYFNMREIFGGQQTYYVTVAPGVDLAMLAAICVCLDERENEKK
ncbi:tubby C-terminal-like domain-containing protein [Rhexocercosporidium sp. MPI-PUGE-AT-0058]|nr:tubby C-terminal-like domain-containing protein [Rhexocercosporidium sp. MPI-PUGE-AT-0058]